MQLGEDAFSYGYGGTGKISEMSKFRDYGIPFGVGDVIGCYLVSIFAKSRILYAFKRAIFFAATLFLPSSSQVRRGF